MKKMGILKNPIYEELVSISASCLSVSCFFLLLLIILPASFLFLVPVLITIIGFNSFFIVKKIFKKRSIEEFDLTSPTTFETGALIFRSKQNKYAVFCSLALVLKNYKRGSISRTLAILLKVLPTSSVLSLERLSRKSYFVNFYIKIGDPSNLSQTRELIANIQTSFEKMVGKNNVRLLEGNELLEHLTLGIPGKLSKVKTSRGKLIQIKTDKAQHTISIGRISSNDLEDSALNELLLESEKTRIILAIRKEETCLGKIKQFIIFSVNREKNNSNISKELAPIQFIPSSTLLRSVGDFLTRSLIKEPFESLSYQQAVHEFQNFLFASFDNKNGTPAPKLPTQHWEKRDLSGLDWRKAIMQIANRLGLNYEKDVFIHSNGLPIRFDAKINDAYISIISNSAIDQFRWQVSTLEKMLDEEQVEILVLLTSQTLLKKIQEQNPEALPHQENIRIILDLKELENFLQNPIFNSSHEIKLTTKAT